MKHKSTVLKVGSCITFSVLGFFGTVSAEMMTNEMNNKTEDRKTSVADSAEFLADLNIIEKKEYTAQYNFGNEITRREMLKVMMNISGKKVTSTCTGKFSDLKSSDWGCKYAEAALANGYIAKNEKFLPDSNVTQIEALKMIMQAKGIEKNVNADWRKGYELKAMSEGIIISKLSFDSPARRLAIFDSAARTYSEFKSVPQNNISASSDGVNTTIMNSASGKEISYYGSENSYGITADKKYVYICREPGETDGTFEVYSYNDLKLIDDVKKQITDEVFTCPWDGYTSQQLGVTTQYNLKNNTLEFFTTDREKVLGSYIYDFSTLKVMKK